MRTLATKQPTHDSAKQNKGGSRVRSACSSASRSRSVSSLSTGMPLLQRKCACGGGCPRCKENLGIQTKLKIGEPGDKYEQEADRVADEVMRMPETSVQRQVEPEEEEEEEMVQRKANISSISSVNQGKSDIPPIGNQASGDLESRLNPSQAGGSPLSEDVRGFMEPRFGADFSGVRVHTGGEAVQMNQELGAQAFTNGSDVYFGAGKEPGNNELTAHELTHVVQQGGASRGGLVIQRWQNLGTEHWSFSGVTRNIRNMTVWTGSKSEWRSELDNMDNESEYNARLRGFLKVSNDPSIVNRTRPRDIGNMQNYRNTIERAPNDQEKLEFLRALYEMAGNLDLWHGGVLEGGKWLRWSDRHLATFLRNNQGMLITDVSSQGEVIDSAGVRAVSDQGGRRATMAMIINAGATAHKGVDLIMTANRQSGQARESAHVRAMETVRNAGRVIREVLKEHDARVAFQQQVVGQVFNTVWGLIPGGGTIANAAKDLLKAGLEEALKKAQEEDSPSAQAEQINSEFVATCHRLVHASHITSADANDAINGFEAVRR